MEAVSTRKDEISAEVMRIYDRKIKKYENNIDDLTIEQRARLYALLFEEAMFEAALEFYTFDKCKEEREVVNEQQEIYTEMV